MTNVTAPQLWLVRHGATEWSTAGRHTGRTDLPLTDEGVEQAEAATALLAELHPDPSFARVLTSPLLRARQTAEVAGHADAAVDEDLQEWDYGTYDGRTTADIRSECPGWSLWRDGCPGGETAAEVGARADRVIDRLSDFDGDVLLFAHGHLLRVLGARWVGLPPEDGALLRLDTASLSVLGWEREQRVVTAWNQRRAVDRPRRSTAAG